MKVLRKKTVHIVLSFLLIVLVALSFLLPAVTTASAAETNTSIYTNVMDDLQKDENFDVADYPVVEDDYSLNVIQVAESSDGELFVYVYQPSHPIKDLIATTIRLSISNPDDELTYTDYTLALLDTDGVFDKYKVLDFIVKSDSVRYYEIVLLTRMWDASIDKTLDNDNTISQVPCKIGQQWTVYSLGDDIVYSMIDSDFVEITDKFVGYQRYPQGLVFDTWEISKCDSHYVAFSTDIDIERLYEVELEYKTTYTHEWCNLTDGVGVSQEHEEHHDVITYFDKVYTPDSWPFPSYSWSRIQTAASFISSEELTDSARVEIENKDWVLRFFESSFVDEKAANYSTYNYKYTRVSAVTILRLYFETEGTVYNLGVVDNMQTGSEIPTNPQPDFSFLDEWRNRFNSFLDYLKLFVSLIVLGFLVWLFSPVIKFLFGLIWQVVCFPFKMLGKFFNWLFVKRKNSRY